MGSRRLLGNAILLLGSMLVGVLMAEFGARLLVEPADYLSVETVNDEVLGIRIKPGTAGFDDWGFRNASVPPMVDVLAVGDSHTYGNNAKATESWPSVVADLTGLDVYNLGMGGYGPNQYYELIRRHVSTLRPKLVLMSLYMGDDFENAFLMTYGMDHWSYLRNGSWTRADANIWETVDQSSWHQRLRLWLSRNSLLYRLVVHGALAPLKGYFQIQRAANTSDDPVATLTLKAEGLSEAFRPLSLVSRLDQGSPIVKEGMRITFELIQRSKALCQENGARLVVVVIPTKETVFADYLLREEASHLRSPIARLVSDEKEATAQLTAFLDAAGIPHIETVDALRARVSEHLYTVSDRDMHPAANGYRAIGTAIAESLATLTQAPGIE